MIKLGFSASKRHVFEEIIVDGKPTGTYICVTCEKGRTK